MTVSCGGMTTTAIAKRERWCNLIGRQQRAFSTLLNSTSSTPSFDWRGSLLVSIFPSEQGLRECCGCERFSGCAGETPSCLVQDQYYKVDCFVIVHCTASPPTVDLSFALARVVAVLGPSFFCFENHVQCWPTLRHHQVSMPM